MMTKHFFGTCEVIGRREGKRNKKFLMAFSITNVSQQQMQQHPQHVRVSHSEQPQTLVTLPKLEETVGASVTATLLVRHLPEAMPQDTISRLFAHYGASSVRPCAGGRLRNCAFVDFMDEDLASQAQSQLNRLRFLGKVLSVERAGKAHSNNKNQQSEVQSVQGSTGQPFSFLKDSSVIGNVSKGGIPSSVSIGEPIASRLGVDYPFPPDLKYAYPPPDGNILTNIVGALISVPRFYTQVLHLMNKMNIPAPFRPALPTPHLPPPVPASPPPPPISAKPPLMDVSDDESELESSEDDVSEAVHNRKRAKREAIVGPAVDRAVAHEDVGLKPVTLVPKEVLMIKKKNTVLQIKIAPKLKQHEFIDGDSSMKASMETADEHFEPKPYATPQEIEGEKLPPQEILSLSMFKNYNAGNPASVLYIKNLAKDMVVDDFYFIFGSLFDSVEDAKSGLNIKLMQEGRMRGQAFVTFPSTDLAHHALNLVNGYVFKGKPMIIQFGRNPSAGKTN